MSHSDHNFAEEPKYDSVGEELQLNTEEMKYDTDFKASATKPIHIERLPENKETEIKIDTKKKDNSSSYFSESYDSSSSSESDDFGKRDI